MSGIAGIIRFDDAPVQPELVKKMTNAMPYRGPDGINHWIKGAVGLGQCMLCTTPESLEEKQPLTNEDESLVLVMDGRVDNWEELRKELNTRSVRLRDRSDAGLVLKAYALWGEKCLEHIDGDYAFVIWDAHKQSAFCARDRLGNKPFYYHWNGKAFVFASELHPILTLPWVKPDLNLGMVAEFLSSEWYTRDETFCNGVYRLMASHKIEINPKEMKLDEYWSPDLNNQLDHYSADEFAEAYLALITDTVKRMSRTHTPLACEVSGGLDSSALFAIAKSLHNSNALLSPIIEGYTLDYQDDPSASEIEYAREASKFLGLGIYEIEPASLPISWYQRWSDEYLDFPNYPSGTMSWDLRAKASQRGSRVLYSGMGGDEWLGGDYGYYAKFISDSQWSNLIDMIKVDSQEFGILQTFIMISRHGVFPLLTTPMQNALRKIYHIVRSKHIKERRAWLSPHFQSIIERRRKHYQGLNNLRSIRPGMHGRIHSLYDAYSIFSRELEERLAARSQIEMRRPYWSEKLVQFSFSTSPHLRLSGNTNKLLHRNAMAGLLPESILTRMTKAEFTSTFNAPLKKLRDHLMHDIPGRRTGWVKPNTLEILYNKCSTGDDQNGARPVWGLWALFGCDCVANSLELDKKGNFD
jgi:asparagine synthase (glutamine-hydrolysing)